uniref:DNA methylase n=1 Tax=Candidatus Kentrum sp. DK TaxID=2126562 RepID=A0A450SY20_9GAMM|nr:MAG: hypothetical protein BECKDK2373C_GA0170839_106822 [Candidatus Kentron sp. DK]
MCKFEANSGLFNEDLRKFWPISAFPQQNHPKSDRLLDAVFTDPPYFGNVQYGELMDFCYVWLRRLVGKETEGFQRLSTRSAQELTGNATEARYLDHFTEGLAKVYTRMAKALKPGAPLAFTYHHNKIEAYHAVGVAILDAGLICSASLPCPAEMAGSIHIRGTASSIVDTVFVCRKTGTMPKKWLFQDEAGVATIVAGDLAELRESGMKPTQGDTRCITFGHLTRMAVWNLRKDWRSEESTPDKFQRFAIAIHALGAGDPERILQAVDALDRKIRTASATPIKQGGAVTDKRIRALVETACQLLTKGAPKTPGNIIRSNCRKVFREC